MTKHTPGPWEDNDAGLVYGAVTGDEDEAPFVCDVCNEPGSGEYTEQEQANARLIAAAPKLLEGLKKAHFALESVAYLTGNNDLLPYIRICKDAIDQAEGSSAENAVLGARPGPTDKEEAEAYEAMNRWHKEQVDAQPNIQVFHSHAPKAFTMEDCTDDVEVTTETSEAVMRAIVINAEAQTVSETDIDGKLASIQEIVGGLIDPVYHGLDSKHHCYVNDEGLLNNPQHFFMLRDGHQPLAGNGVILSTTRNGDEAPCTLALDWVKERVTFMDLQAVREWVAREPGQEVFGSFVGESEVTDSKAAKKEALAEARAETEQSIAEGKNHGRENSR